MQERPFPQTYSVCGFTNDGGRRWYCVCPHCWFEWIEERTGYVPHSTSVSIRCPNEACGKAADYAPARWVGGDPAEHLESAAQSGLCDAVLASRNALAQSDGNQPGDLDLPAESNDDAELPTAPESSTLLGERGERVPETDSGLSCTANSFGETYYEPLLDSQSHWLWELYWCNPFAR